MAVAAKRACPDDAARTSNLYLVAAPTRAILCRISVSPSSGDYGFMDSCMRGVFLFGVGSVHPLALTENPEEDKHATSQRSLPLWQR